MPKKNKTNKKTNFWTRSTPEFKLIHFIVGVVALAIIFPTGLYIYKQFFPRSFPPDVNEQSQIPPEVKKTLEVKKAISLRIPILLYHYVEYVKDKGDTIRISLNIEPYAFESQVKTLKNTGYTFITPNQIPDLLEGKMSVPKKPIILTFDDGYRDFYTDVLPIIKKYDARVVAYIVPGFLGKPNNLTHQQLKEIAESKLVEIGAHTVDHAYLKGLNEKRVRFEVEQSKDMLEKELHIPIVSFAYPYGAFDLNAIQIVKNAHFKTAVSTVDGVDINKDNLFFIYRIRPGYRTGKELLNFLDQLHPAP